MLHTGYFSFGMWLRHRRQALRLTQAALAGRVMCATITIAKIERDERRPSGQIALLLARALAINTELHPLFIAAARGEAAIGRLPHPLVGAEAAILADLTDEHAADRAIDPYEFQLGNP